MRFFVEAHIWMEGDSFAILHDLLHDHSSKTNYGHYFENRDAKRMLQEIEWKATHVYKERNRSTDYLVQCAHPGRRIRLKQFPQDLVDLCSIDNYSMVLEWIL